MSHFVDYTKQFLKKDQIDPDSMGILPIRDECSFNLNTANAHDSIFMGHCCLIEFETMVEIVLISQNWR